MKKRTSKVLNALIFSLFAICVALVVFALYREQNWQERFSIITGEMEEIRTVLMQGQNTEKREVYTGPWPKMKVITNQTVAGDWVDSDLQRLESRRCSAAPDGQRENLVLEAYGLSEFLARDEAASEALRIQLEDTLTVPGEENTDPLFNLERICEVDESTLLLMTRDAQSPIYAVPILVSNVSESDQADWQITRIQPLVTTYGEDIYLSPNGNPILWRDFEMSQGIGWSAHLVSRETGSVNLIEYCTVKSTEEGVKKNCPRAYEGS